MNEITAFGDTAGPQWASPAYDLAGNMTQFPQPNSPTAAYTSIYDAWNRLVGVVDESRARQCSSTSTMAVDYRIVAETYASGVVGRDPRVLLFGRVAGYRGASAGPRRSDNSSGACGTSTTSCCAIATRLAMARSTSGSTPCRTRTGTSRPWPARPAQISKRFTGIRRMASQRS